MKKTNAVKHDNGSDIIHLILQDHKPLKKLIKVLKNPDVEFAQKRPAYEEFAPLLLQHADPEQKSLYAYLKEDTEDLRPDGYEGDTEHAIASELIDEINGLKNKDEWMAKVKVLGELVEHHIEEEEGDMFKKVKKELDMETRVQIGIEYTQLKEDFDITPARRSAKTKKQPEIRMHH